MQMKSRKRKSNENKKKDDDDNNNKDEKQNSATLQQNCPTISMSSEKGAAAILICVHKISSKIFVFNQFHKKFLIKLHWNIPDKGFQDFDKP